MRWRYYALGVLAYATILVATLPATLVDARLKEESQGRLRLADAVGTLWSGSGRLEIRDANGTAGYGKAVQWYALPRSLLRAQLSFEIVVDAAPSPLLITATRAGIDVSRVDVRLPVAATRLGLQPLSALQLGGELRLRISQLLLGRAKIRGSAILEWRAASSSLSPVSPLGDYELHLEADGSQIKARLHTLQGPLQLEGGGAWTVGTKPAFFITARAPPGPRERLAPFLQLIAVESADGSFQIKNQ